MCWVPRRPRSANWASAPPRPTASTAPPRSTFGFDQAFGREPNPGTKMPYFQATNQDWWDEDGKSPPTYNTHVRAAAQPSGIAENLYDSGPVYDYAVNITSNPPNAFRARWPGFFSCT